MKASAFSFRDIIYNRAACVHTYHKDKSTFIGCLLIV